MKDSERCHTEASGSKPACRPLKPQLAWLIVSRPCYSERYIIKDIEVNHTHVAIIKIGEYVVEQHSFA